MSSDNNKGPVLEFGLVEYQVELVWDDGTLEYLIEQIWEPYSKN